MLLDVRYGGSRLGLAHLTPLRLNAMTSNFGQSTKCFVFVLFCFVLFVCFYRALRQRRRGNIALVTTPPVLDCLCPGRNLCRAGVWGERPPLLTKNTQAQLNTFNELKRVSASSYHCDTCTGLSSQPSPHCCRPSLTGRKRHNAATVGLPFPAYHFVITDESAMALQLQSPLFDSASCFLRTPCASTTRCDATQSGRRLQSPTADVYLEETRIGPRGQQELLSLRGWTPILENCCGTSSIDHDGGSTICGDQAWQGHPCSACCRKMRDKLCSIEHLTARRAGADA